MAHEKRKAVKDNKGEHTDLIVSRDEGGPSGGAPVQLLADSNRTGMVRQLPRALWQRLRAACDERRRLAPREVMTCAGEPVRHSALLLDGIMVRYVKDSAGNRLMVAVQLPGDFVDLHGLPLGKLDHDVLALGAAQVALFPHEALHEIMEARAEDARQLWRLTMIDASIHRHWTFRIGRLRATASLANFLCEMDLRMRLCDRAEEGNFALGLTQIDLAEISGLSPVHVSRVLKDLRDGGLCSFRDGVVEILDRAGLYRIACFDPSYLYLPWAAPSA